VKNLLPLQNTGGAFSILFDKLFVIAVSVVTGMGYKHVKPTTQHVSLLYDVSHNMLNLLLLFIWSAEANSSLFTLHSSFT